VFADLDQALQELPHERIAVQWDVAVEIGLLAAGFGADPVDLATLVPGLARCLDQVPDDVPAGMHLCYGDYQHHHFVQPGSLELQVKLVNAVTEAASRTPSWFSFTVPQGRSDDAYFAPLRGLNTGTDTELAFALVPYHPDEQAAGTTAEQARLIDTSLAQTPAGARDWAICTECGMGRAERDDVPTLLDLHREILAGNR
jgi:methionine synthase II (cobalamin-independent)